MRTMTAERIINHDPTITSGAHIPIWMMPETYPDRKQPTYPKLEHDITTDACIIGGGISGLTTAYFLLKAGKGVVLLEDGEIASAESGRTTGAPGLSAAKFSLLMVF
jgi:monoamine oxidase